MLETTRPGATGDIRSRLEDDSLTKKTLRWLFNANQAGILDPDSVTQKYDTVSAKYTDGSVFFSIWHWAASGYNTTDHVGAANPQGYMQFLTGDMLIPIWPDDLVGGSGRAMAIGAGTKNLDAALAYLNHFYSVEGQELLFNLPEGVIWEKGSDGLGHIKESAWQYLDNDAGIPAIGGSKAGEAAGIINTQGIAGAEISPITGQFMDRNLWPEVILHNASNNLFKRWSATNNGAISYYDLITSTGRSVKVNSAGTLVAPVPQEIQSIVTQIGSVLKTNFWRMVFAANEAEFEALWKDAQSKADTLGMQQVVNWGKTAWAKAQADAALYR
jgi:hypothetical protein